MSILIYLLETTAKKPKKPKARPKTNLWFKQPQYWTLDVQRTRAKHKFMQDELGNQYATSEEEEEVYGVWYKDRRQGITFFTPRPTHVVAGRNKLTAIEG